MTTHAPDYYTILGIPADATLADIKKAYRKLARRHHPDKNPGDPAAAERFRQITEAYEALTILIGRTYDATRHSHGHHDQPLPPASTSRPSAASWPSWRTPGRPSAPAIAEIPLVVIIIASGTDGKQARYGHHAPGRWHVNHEERTEIMISGEGLRRDARDVLGTLLHEAAHALAAARGIKDTSRQGRYHNKHFKTLCEELGITVDFDERIGWSITTVPSHTADAYADQLAALHAAMTLWRTDEMLAPTQRRNSNLIAAICPCGRSIRAAASTLAEAPIICTACGEPFTPKNADA